ncbi:TolC family protein [Synechococcus sp. BS56D]|nr:TolC family protein [Synechococcus sp. BS56D]
MALKACSAQLVCALLLVVESACFSGDSVAQAGNTVPEAIPLVDQKKVSPSQLVEQLKQLQDQIKANSRPVSLAEAIKLGLQNNPELASSFSAIQQFEWQLIAAQRSWYPTLQLTNGTPFIGSNWGTFVQDQYALPNQQVKELQAQGLGRKSATKSQQFVVQPGAQVNWNFLDPTRQPNINAAADSLLQQKFLFDVSARNLVLQIQESYYAIQSNQQLINSFQKIYMINQKQLEILEARKSIGMVTVLDLEQTRSQLYGQLSQLVLYTSNYIEQTALLAQQLALPANQLAIPDQPAQMQGRWQVPLQETIRRAMQQREEILASLAAAESSKWSSVALLRQYLPVFSLVATGSLIGQNGYQNIPVPNDPGSQYARNRQWNAAIGIGFNWMLFDGGIDAANAQAFKTQAQQQLAQAALTELQVTQQVRSSYGQYQTSQVAVTTARQAYRSAEVAQEAARARFEVGVGDITSVVQTIQQLSSAAQQLSQAVLGYNNAVAELYRYSATWPGASQQDVQERLKMMRDSPEPLRPDSLTRLGL